MCAIVGAVGDNATYLTKSCLHALQHRGQQGCGILSSDGDYYVHRRRGIVSEAFQNGALDSLKGNVAIGHTRYSTFGGDTESNLQPITINYPSGWLSIAHNGHLSDSAEWIASLKRQGAEFQTTTDTEIILQLIAKRDLPFLESVVDSVRTINGAYSLLLLNSDYLLAIRDPHGLRPLVYGEYKGNPIFASESCAFDFIGGKTHGEVKPGEMIIFNIKTGSIDKQQIIETKKISRCVFELIYFSRPDSKIFNHSVYEVRKSLGRKLAQEQPANADIVIPVPDSGTAAAIGYADEIGLPFDTGIIRSHFIRTFIQPKQSMRDEGVRMKLSTIKSVIDGKRVIVVDDSLVRGTTSKQIIQMVRDAGAKEIHFRISSPPTISPCHYGIATPTNEELIAHNMTVDEIREFIVADSIGYLSLKGLSEVCGTGYCTSCFTGTYLSNISTTV